VLQKTISAIRPETWEEINRVVLSNARQVKLEDGAVVRLDSTETSALMHEPSDSSLLWDAVRIMVRLLKQADALAGGGGLEWHDHCRAARKRARKIQFTRGRPNRVQLYRELIGIAHATLAYLRQAAERLAATSTPLIALWLAQVRHNRPLIERIITQSEWRVLAGELVAASDKLVGHSGRSSRLAPGVFVLRPDITRCTLSGIAEQRREAIPWCGTGSSGSGYPSRRLACCSARCSLPHR
jgi:IS5 family transposase